MRKLRLGLCLFLAVVFAPSVFQAQQPATAPVTIHVTDQTGAVIPHAQIQLVPVPENAPAKLETDDSGALSLNLGTGGYVLSVSRAAFVKYTRHIDISIPEGQTSAIQIIPVVLEAAHSSGVEFDPAAFKGSLILESDQHPAAPKVVSPAEFHALPHVPLTVHNGHTDVSETYSGVPLSTLLAKVNAPLGKELRGKAMTSYVIATGSDGYAVVLSLAEVDPDFHPGQVIVADTRDGQPLGKNGPFQLIVSEDKRPARWVHNLDRINLRQAQ
jgi:hypothetical protein